MLHFISLLLEFAWLIQCHKTITFPFSISQLTYSDDSPCEVEDIFYDPNDTWEKGMKLNTPNGVSPRVYVSVQSVV